MSEVKEFLKRFEEYLKGKKHKEKIEILLEMLVALGKEIKEEEEKKKEAK